MQARLIACGLLFSLLLSLGCKSTQSTLGGSEQLSQHTWTLVELAGKPVASSDSVQAAYLTFTDQKVSGSTSCNRLNGSFTLSGKNKIRFSPLATTKMFCTGENVESAFLAAMSQVESYRITNDGLTLNHGQLPVAKFKAHP